MRGMIIGLAFTLAAALAVAKPPAPQSPEKPTKTFTPSAEVSALIAKAKSERKEGQPLVTEPMLELGSYDGHLEYRASVGNASVHEKEAEAFYVIDGSATMVTGGKLVKETRTNSTNLSGSAIEGGASRTIAKGDFILVPENTPHWFSSIDGVLVLFSMHVPRP
jgi:mannose-6-phosphate isomerase-like protein (cupin superfamily)